MAHKEPASGESQAPSAGVPGPPDSTIARAQIIVHGIVQGVGFRPNIYRLAKARGLAGWVANNTEGVTIDAEGPADSLQAFIREIQGDAPPLAVIEEVLIKALPPLGQRVFEIRASESRDGQFVPISPDVATCDDCLRELFDPTDRRYHYPFINCTNCGPRFTIVKDIPYDRPKTTMGVFAMCPACAREYHDPADRRFHAQPDACADCGPRIWLVDRDGRVVGRDGIVIDPASGAADQPAVDSPESGLASDTTIALAASLLARGDILAVRGVGGFHLVCDATNERAVARLRERKRRVDKPFAIMSPDTRTVGRYCRLSETERGLLESAARPIVLLTSRGAADQPGPIAASVAPGNRNLGVMLPYTPLHHLLLSDFGRQRLGQALPVALVFTSGNLNEEPIATGNAEALIRLADLADYFLFHDREIETRCDDSVARVFRGRPMLLRRSRGYAPAPVRLRAQLGSILAVGGELKNAFCLTRDHHAFLSQHIGDVENNETYESLVGAIEHYERLFRVTPEVIAYDLHPGYLSTRYAQEQLAEQPGRLVGVPVQHHQAHVASCAAENGLDGPVIGVAFDGTGYGIDGAVWGGEVFVGNVFHPRRAAHIGYVSLPGGDLAVRRPWRMALSHLRAAFGPDLAALDLPLLARVPKDEARVVSGMLAAGLNSPPTSSAGRLFDAVAAILGVRDVVNYEGQAAIELEALADAEVTDAFDWEPVRTSAGGASQASDQATLIIDPSVLIRAVVADQRAGAAVPKISARFHNAVARAIVATCAALRRETSLDRVCLSGGVFQNAFLLGRTLDWLADAGFQVSTHRLVPPNDGGIALGQAVIAAARVADGSAAGSVGRSAAGA